MGKKIADVIDCPRHQEKILGFVGTRDKLKGSYITLNGHEYSL